MNATRTTPTGPLKAFVNTAEYITDDLETGTAAEQEAAQVLHALCYAINHERTAELYAQIEPLIDKWLVESMQEMPQDDADRESVIAALRLDAVLSRVAWSRRRWDEMIAALMADAVTA